MQLFKVVVKDGILIKGIPHNEASLKNLNLWDFVFLEDELLQVVAFNEDGRPLFADSKTTFNIIQ